METSRLHAHAQLVLVKEIMEAKASIIIVTHNHRRYIKPCLESIIRQDFPHEIIVVDNCSKDSTAEFVKENFPSVKVVKSWKNMGYGAGNNLGINYARGMYLVILNPDTIVEEHWLRELVKPLKSKIITTPKILLYNGSAINTCGNVNHFTGLTFTRYLGEKPDAFLRQEYVTGFSGCCFAIEKEDFLQLEGFDENFFAYNEDSDLSWRAHLKGFKIKFIPTSIIRHDYTLEVPPGKIFHLEKGRYMILRKYLSWKDFSLLSPSLLIAELLTLAYAIKQGRKGLKCKLKAIESGLRIKINKVDGSRDNLLKSLSATIPVEQLTFNKWERMLKILANKVFEWNFKVIA